MIYLFLEIYVNDIKGNVCNQNSVPKILKETVATAWVDGQSGLGPVVGNFCTDLAVEKAKNVGIGWVVAKSNFFLKRCQKCISRKEKRKGKIFFFGGVLFPL